MDTVLFEKQGNIGTITMNRPKQLNAMNAELVEDLAQGFSKAAADDDVVVIILAGNGRSFCAGLDLKDSLATGSTKLVLPESKTHNPYLVEALDKPVIAAVNGHAYGAGLHLAARADVRIASETAAFQMTEIIHGSVSGADFWIRQGLSYVATFEMLSGKTIYARRALEMGFINAVVPPERLLPAAREEAARLLSLPREAMMELTGLSHYFKRNILSTVAPDYMAMVKEVSERFQGAPEVKEAMEKFAATKSAGR